VDLKWDDWSLECLSFDNMISAIQNGSADIAMGCLSITSDRLKFMKFSTPTYDSGLVLVTIKENLTSFWLFFEPFDYTMWSTVVMIIIINSHLIWVAEQHEDGPISTNYSIGILESLQHSILSLLLLGNLRLRSLTGKFIQISYWCIGLSLILCYLSTISAILSIDWLSSKIQSYQDIQTIPLGGFSDYETVLRLYNSDFYSYNWTFENSENMITDLSAGKIKAVALPYPFALYLSKSDCKFLIVGQRFVADYFAFGFRLNIDNGLYYCKTTLFHFYTL
jgi:ABC-type amino acid transport substrate-binding protein